MRFNELFNELDNIQNRKNRLVNYRCLIMAFILTSTLASSNGPRKEIKSASQEKRDFDYSMCLDLDTDYYEQNNYGFANYNPVSSDNSHNYDPNNLDFSDFPYTDGTIESQVNIANYIRELVKDIPNQYKYQYILEHFQMTSYELQVELAVLNHESMGYIDSFASVTSVFNRMISRVKCGYVKHWMHLNREITMFDHITAKNQYEPYGNDHYLDSMDISEGECYQACLDALFVMDVIPQRMHCYMDFVDKGLRHLRPNSVQFVSGGDYYSNPLTEEDTIPLSERYYYVEENFLIRK